MYNKTDHTISFIDIVFNTLMFFVLLVVILLVNQAKKVEETQNIKPNCLFVIEVSWGDVPSDIDIYLEDPVGNLIFYKDKDRGLMSIDRDNVGHHEFTDKERTQGMYNREVVTIRGAIPGEYIFNLHAYAKRVPEPVKVNIAIRKMLPFGTVFETDVLMTEDGQENTVCRFTLDKDGNFSNVNFRPKMFTRKRDNSL